MADPLVFISYSTQDRTIAGMICQALEQKLIPCWIAPRNVPLGNNAFDAIPQGISECKVFVVVLSESSSRSDYVQREIQVALSKKKTIIPLRIEDIQPDRAVDFLLTGVQWLDAFVPPIERHIDTLVKRVAAVVEADLSTNQLPRPGGDPFALFKPHRTSRRLALPATAILVTAVAVAGYFWHLRPAPRPAPQNMPTVALSDGTLRAPSPKMETPSKTGIANQSTAITLAPNRTPTSPRSAPAPRPNATIAELTPNQLRSRAAVLTAQQKLREGDPVSAENYFLLAVNLDPDNHTAQTGLDAVRKELGEN